MAQQRESVADQIMRHAKAVQPELWERTEEVARIIDPAAFANDWIVQPDEAASLHQARLACMRARAMSKAQEVLRYLGVNTDTDWLEILTQMAADGQ